MNRTALEKDTKNTQTTLYMAMEVSKASWKLGFSTNGTKVRVVTTHGGSVPSVVRAIAEAKVKLGLGKDVRVLSCYEAGRDGFWIHRALLAEGIENVVIDRSALEVDRRKKRAKTDRIDVTRMVLQLIRHDQYGDRLRIVRVPTPEEEDARRPIRELERLKKERSAHQARMRALLALHGVDQSKLSRGFGLLVPKILGKDGKPLPRYLVEELRRETERLELVRSQIVRMEKERAACLDKCSGKSAKMAAQLMQLRGIGANAATVTSYEFFSWRAFKNGKQVGSCAGLTGTPYDSGGSSREQGISKAGNKHVRAIIIEIAWQWLRYQEQSRLSKWYQSRFEGMGKRARRVGIVALARKLLVALWRYVDQGIIPDGALMKAV